MDNKEDRDRYEPVMRKDPKTGEVYFTNKKGNIKYVTEMRKNTSTNMAETTDAYTLVSRQRHPMEIIYADYANSMKALANRARIEKINTGRLMYNPNANKIYKNEVQSLENKLKEGKMNTIKEREATRRASSELKRKKELNPNLKGEDERKIGQRLMNKYRQETGAIPRRERSINITDKEWEAIQAGAISENKLKEILDHSNPDILRERAMPSNKRQLTSAQINRIKAMSTNFTLAEIAKKMNVSTSTISNILKGGK